MTYAEAIQFLYDLQLFGANFGLETTRKLATLSGCPQEKLRFIHVAGTNGKGSTCAMLESIYRTAGLRVGLFTSPHLVSFRERLQINRRLVPETEVARLVAELQTLLRKFPDDEHPTMFEVVTVMALKYFAEQQCDLVIWETGLGGRLDATNIVTPLASVITNIALDHTQWLGDTLGKIAAEKAGIIKPRIPVITSAENPEALDVIEQIARANHAPVTRVTAQSVSGNPHPTALLGDHQKINGALAVTVVQTLQPKIPVTDQQIHAGLATVNWPGRLQLIRRGGQTFLLDGAHNVAGAETLLQVLKKDFSDFTPVFIFGALADKNWPDICKIFSPRAKKVLTVPVTSQRTAAAEELANAFRRANTTAEVTACCRLAEAIIACKNEPFVVITGSLYLIGEALEQLGAAPGDGGERGLNEWFRPR